MTINIFIYFAINGVEEISKKKRSQIQLLELFNTFIFSTQRNFIVSKCKFTTECGLVRAAMGGRQQKYWMKIRITKELNSAFTFIYGTQLVKFNVKMSHKKIKYFYSALAQESGNLFLVLLVGFCFLFFFYMLYQQNTFHKQ